MHITLDHMKTLAATLNSICSLTTVGNARRHFLLPTQSTHCLLSWPTLPTLPTQSYVCINRKDLQRILTTKGCLTGRQTANDAATCIVESNFLPKNFLAIQLPHCPHTGCCRSRRAKIQGTQGISSQSKLAARSDVRGHCSKT